MQTQVMNKQPDLSPKQLIDYFDLPPKRIHKFIKISFKTWLIATGITFLAIMCTHFVTSPTTTIQQDIFSSIPLSILWGGIFALPLIVAILLLIRYRTKVRPTDAEYDAWVNNWIAPIRQYGLQKLGIDEKEVMGKVLFVRGLVWPRTPEAMYYHNSGYLVRYKWGKDGLPRTSVNSLTFFYPMANHIAVFICDVNAFGSLRHEATRTYFYDDMVGVETTSFGQPLETGAFYTSQRFELRVSSGQSIGATVRTSDPTVDETVRALRVLLRDKKHGTRGGGRGLAGY